MVPTLMREEFWSISFYLVAQVTCSPMDHYREEIGNFKIDRWIRPGEVGWGKFLLWLIQLKHTDEERT
jgi:hypothetical protein